MSEKKLRARRIIATATLTAAAVAFLLLSTRSATVSATPPAAAPSNQAADKQVPSDSPEAEETSPVQTGIELEALSLYANPDGTPPVVEEKVEPAHLEPKVPANTSPPGSQQSLFKSRRAMETIDAREFLRRSRVARQARGRHPIRSPVGAFC